MSTSYELSFCAAAFQDVTRIETAGQVLTQTCLLHTTVAIVRCHESYRVDSFIGVNEQRVPDLLGHMHRVSSSHEARMNACNSYCAPRVGDDPSFLSPRDKCVIHRDSSQDISVRYTLNLCYIAV